MSNENIIAELMRNIFGESAIQAGAICEQLEDVKYCTDHKMNHLNGGNEKMKWEKAKATAEALAERDATFTVANMQRFQVAVNEYLRKNPCARLYDGLTETEHFAVRRFYYFNNN